MKKDYFWTDGTRIKSKRVINAFLEGRLVEKRGSGKQGSRWLASCSVDGCENVYNFSRSWAPCCKLSLCKRHLQKKIGEKIRQDKKKDNPPTTVDMFWSDGSRILGQRIQEAFSRGVLTRRVVRDKNTVTWYARCEESGCSNEYYFSSKNLKTTKEARCAEHCSEAASFSQAVVKYVNGVPTRSLFLQQHKDRVIWRQTRLDRHENSAFFRCTVDGCTNLKQYKPSGKNPFVCHSHVVKNTKKEPYGAIYKAFISSTAARSKRRVSPIEVTITYTQFVQICETQQDCFYCRSPLNRQKFIVKPKKGQPYSRAALLDRIDVNGPYSVENVVSCCGTCNACRGVFVGFEEMIILGLVRQEKFSEICSFAEKNAKHLAEWREKMKKTRFNKQYGSKRTGALNQLLVEPKQ